MSFLKSDPANKERTAFRAFVDNLSNIIQPKTFASSLLSIHFRSILPRSKKSSFHICTYAKPLQNLYACRLLLFCMQRKTKRDLKTKTAVGDQPNGGTVLTKNDIGFDVKVTWLAISRMFGPLALEHGITVSMGFAMLNISKEKGTPATKIAPLLGMEPRSLTRLIKKLEEDGLVRRQPDPEDTRSVRIFLTALGVEKRAIAQKVVEDFNEKVRKTVKAKELQTFFDVLEKIQYVIKENTNGKA